MVGWAERYGRDELRAILLVQPQGKFGAIATGAASKIQKLCIAPIYQRKVLSSQAAKCPSN